MTTANFFKISIYALTISSFCSSSYASPMQFNDAQQDAQAISPAEAMMKTGNAPLEIPMNDPFMADHALSAPTLDSEVSEESQVRMSQNEDLIADLELMLSQLRYFANESIITKLHGSAEKDEANSPQTTGVKDLQASMLATQVSISSEMKTLSEPNLKNFTIDAEVIIMRNRKNALDALQLDLLTLELEAELAAAKDRNQQWDKMMNEGRAVDELEMANELSSGVNTMMKAIATISTAEGHIEAFNAAYTSAKNKASLFIDELRDTFQGLPRLPQAVLEAYAGTSASTGKQAGQIGLLSAYYRLLVA